MRAFPSSAHILIASLSAVVACGAASAGRPVAAQPHPGARNAALARATTALRQEVWASNPASWAGLVRPIVAFHATQLYGMRELRAAAAAAVLPVAGGSTAVVGRSFGFALYRQTVFSVGYARDVRPGTFRPVHVGLRLDWHSVRVPGLTPGGAAALTVGAIFPVAPLTSIGAVSENLILSGPLKDELPRVLAVGFRFGRPGQIAILADLCKPLRQPASLRTGVEYSPVRALAFRGGITTSPYRVAGGIGLRIRSLVVDLAGEHHYALGWTPSASLHLSW